MFVKSGWINGKFLGNRLEILAIEQSVVVTVTRLTADKWIEFLDIDGRLFFGSFSPSGKNLMSVQIAIWAAFSVWQQEMLSVLLWNFALLVPLLL